MTEWTSISVTESQKETLQDRKPDDVAMGKFLVGAIDSNSNPESKQELMDEIHATLDRIEESEPRGDKSVKDVLNRLDDLETHIDGRFDEVSRR